jgi:pilus assembly protein CpaF
MSTTAIQERRLVDTLQLHLRTEQGDLLAAAKTHLRTIAPLLPSDAQLHVAKRAIAEMTGVGRLEQFLADPSVREVMVNAGNEVFVEDSNGVRRVETLPAGELEAIIERILLPLGKRIDRSSPIVDARLADGSRICAVIPPIAVDGPCLSIRRFNVSNLSLHSFGNDSVVAMLRQIVSARCNIVVTGAASSGKTTLLNALCGEVQPSERIITVEDVAELQLRAEHVVRLEAREAFADGAGAITISHLLRTALRLRPDRFVVGEVRSSEVIDMLAAMNTGHHGSMTTCHSNSTTDVLRRLEALVMQHCAQWPRDAINEHIRAAVDVIVHVGRNALGQREVVEISEVSPLIYGGCTTLFANGETVAPLTRVRA